MRRSYSLDVFVLSAVLWADAATAEKVALLVDSHAGAPVQKAVQVLEAGLRRRGVPTRTIGPSAARSRDEVLVTVSAGRGSSSPKPPAESFSIRKSDADGQKNITISGADDIGLSYGIFELLGQAEGTPSSTGIFEAASPTTRSPGVAVRSVGLFLYNRDLEREWYFSKEFWDSYFELLAKSRFNSFSLIFGHQTSYLAPPFPFLVDVPGYEQVRVPSYTNEERKLNLETLKMISGLADDWGIRFVLGIWQQHAHVYGDSLVQGLKYEDLFDYNPKALAVLLKECPKIRGVQFRMNVESGIDEDDQNRFYTEMVKAIQSSGRPMWIDVRAKGLRAETIESARGLGAKVTVSTKFWREHMGLPFHGTRIDPSDKRRSYRRYGYWDLLPHERPYDVLYQMWTLGSQKILLWGGLTYARRFADSSHLGDAVGFEVFAPLSQKGYYNWPGGSWHIFSNRDLEYYRWEFERYWAFYMALGLSGYAADGHQPIFSAEFEKHFGAGAPAMREAYEAASWIIPFITAARNPSSSSFRYWPEMDTVGLTDYYVHLPTGDDNRFYRISEYVDDYLAGRLSAKFTPGEMAHRLSGWADAVGEDVERAGSLVPDAAANKEFSSTKIDFSVLAELARYHAARIQSAEDYAFFARTGERYHLLRSIEYYRQAVKQWENIVKLTDGVYYDHMVFNRAPDQIGHWKHELPFLRRDLARLEEMDRLFVDFSDQADKVAGWEIESPWHKMIMRWKEEKGVLTRWADEKLHPDGESRYMGQTHDTNGAPIWAPDVVSDRYSMHSPRAVIKDLFFEHRDANIMHAPLRSAATSHPVSLHASFLGKHDSTRLTLFYRWGGQGFDFTSVDMKEEEKKNVYSASVPAAQPGQKLFYYIQALDETSFFHGSAKEPHAIVFHDKSSTEVLIRHDDVLESQVGVAVPIRAEIRRALQPAAVRLHYRHLDQAEDWQIVDMKNTQGDHYQAVIPGEFVVPGWDLMYAIEVVDPAGTGKFYPDWESREPFVVIKVTSETSNLP